MHYMQFMTILNGCDNLTEVFSCNFFLKASLVPHDVVVHVAPVRKLQHQVQLGLCVYHLVQADNVGMLKTQK